MLWGNVDLTQIDKAEHWKWLGYHYLNLNTRNNTTIVLEKFSRWLSRFGGGNRTRVSQADAGLPRMSERMTVMGVWGKSTTKPSVDCRNSARSAQTTLVKSVQHCGDLKQETPSTFTGTCNLKAIQ